MLLKKNKKNGLGIKPDPFFHYYAKVYPFNYTDFSIWSLAICPTKGSWNKLPWYALYMQ